MGSGFFFPKVENARCGDACVVVPPTTAVLIAVPKAPNSFVGKGVVHAPYNDKGRHFPWIQRHRSSCGW
eukprot:3053638-Alexandrium_andersonii.AAC.1